MLAEKVDRDETVSLGARYNTGFIAGPEPFSIAVARTAI